MSAEETEKTSSRPAGAEQSAPATDATKAPAVAAAAAAGEHSGEVGAANANEKLADAASSAAGAAPGAKKHIRISSGQAAMRGRGYFGGDLSIVYWKADVNHEIHETLYVPLRNDQLERALIEAAQEVRFSLIYSLRPVSPFGTRILRVLCSDV